MSCHLKEVNCPGNFGLSGKRLSTSSKVYFRLDCRGRFFRYGLDGYSQSTEPNHDLLQCLRLLLLIISYSNSTLHIDDLAPSSNKDDFRHSRDVACPSQPSGIAAHFRTQHIYHTYGMGFVCTVCTCIRTTESAFVDHVRHSQLSFVPVCTSQ